jgi:hypothetical protein
MATADHTMFVRSYTSPNASCALQTSISLCEIADYQKWKRGKDEKILWGIKTENIK